MKVSNTSERLREIMELRGMRQIDIYNKAQPICEKYGFKLSRADISQYISGKVEPSQKKLTALGEALGVDESWLMGLEVPMNVGLSNPELDAILSNSSDKQKELYMLCNDLTDEQVNIVLEYVKFLLSKK